MRLWRQWGMDDLHFDLAVIGSGPSGQKAAIQGARAGNRVAIVDLNRELGGSCVHRGTIPSKTLRENALRIKNMRSNAEIANFKLNEDLELATLINRLESVLREHDKYMRRQLERDNVTNIHGRAKFLSDKQLEITDVTGSKRILHSDHIIIATGSSPRNPDNIDVDHEHLFDSDSILSMMYLPKSLTVLGGGVIASEYATIFLALGIKVTMVDRFERPLGFLDEDLSEKFLHAFTTNGGVWIGSKTVETSYWNGFDSVVTRCTDGKEIKSEKLLCAAGRSANIKSLDIHTAGIELTDNGLIKVDDNLKTTAPNIYAAGDVIGSPSLASASMEQGRRAACNIFDLPVGEMNRLIPIGIYSIPELSSVGLSEKQAREKYDDIIIGKSYFEEIARGQISGIQDGMLKMICDSKGLEVLGVMIVGEGATELIHIGQMALLSHANVDIFVESIFNFPTLAEAYRDAALEIIRQRTQKSNVF